MKFRKLVFLAHFLAATFAVAADPAARVTAMREALQFRVEMAAAVQTKSETAQDALLRLQTRVAANGLSLSPAVDLGDAALDIGHRLVSVQCLEAAEVFFRASEQAFTQAVGALSRSQTREKAQYLEKLATIRANYLNKRAQAKADIDEAIRLQPEDKSLERSRQSLARGRVEFSNATAGK